MAKSLHLCFVSSDNAPLIEGVKAVLINSDDAGAVRASRALTFSAAGTAADTITIGSRVYTLRAVPTVADDVDIGADAAGSAANLAAAINAGAGAGTAYGTGTTAHPDVTAAAVGAVVTVTARAFGPSGNSIAIAENGTSASWASAATLLAGGTVAAVQAEAVAAINRAKDVSIFPAGYFDTVIPVSTLTDANNPLFADEAAAVFDTFEGVSFVSAP